METSIVVVVLIVPQHPSADVPGRRPPARQTRPSGSSVDVASAGMNKPAPKSRPPAAREPKSNRFTDSPSARPKKEVRGPIAVWHRPSPRPARRGTSRGRSAASPSRDPEGRSARRRARDHRMYAIFERGQHPKISAPAAKRPEEIGIVFGARLQHAPVCGHDVG